MYIKNAMSWRIVLQLIMGQKGVESPLLLGKLCTVSQTMYINHPLLLGKLCKSSTPSGGTT